jgi:hypothetical protein
MMRYQIPQKNCRRGRASLSTQRFIIKTSAPAALVPDVDIAKGAFFLDLTHKMDASAIWRGSYEKSLRLLPWQVRPRAAPASVQELLFAEMR